MIEKENRSNGGDKSGSGISSPKYIKIIITITVFSVFLVILCAILVSCFTGENEKEDPFPPIDPSLLEDTKEEDFDIMEYEEYLALNRTVILENKLNGVSISIDGETCSSYGAAVELVYKMLNTLIDGDYEAYNDMVSKDVGHYRWFSQQQIYEATMYEKSKTQMEGENGSYTEYVIVLKYKIHENNGSYRNNVISDGARPQYIVINDSTGKLMIMDIIDTIG